MPLLGGVQVLFLANSCHKRSSPYPVYTRAFLKEVMRVSMARNYQASGASRCEKVKIGTDVYTLPILALTGATTLQEQYNVHDATRSQILVAPT